MNHRQQFMDAAIQMARKGMEANAGGPFGCVIVKDDVIVGRGHNSVTATNDPTAHAEVVAIRDACKNLSDFQLEGCEVYTTCEPCPMCMGAIYWSRPSAVYFAASREDAARAGFDDSMIYDELTCPLDQRKISMTRLDNSAALALFTDWQQKPDKTAY